MLVWNRFNAKKTAKTHAELPVGIYFAHLPDHGFLIRDESRGSICFVPSKLANIEEAEALWNLGLEPENAAK